MSPARGWIHKWAFEDNALMADADGRAAMQDGYLTEAKISIPTGNVLNAARCAKFAYSFALDGGAVGTITLRGDALPANAIVVGGILEVTAGFTGGVGATGALQLEAANDLITEAVVSGAPWSTTGRKAITPVWSAASAVKTSVARTPAVVVGTNPLTAGVANLFLFYVVADA